MTARPIIFTAASMRGILSGAKTQTRRLIKLDRDIASQGGDLAKAWPDLLWGVTPGLQVPCADGTVQRLRNPYGWPANEPVKLWVKESFAPAWNHPDALTMPEHDGGQNPAHLYYRADVRADRTGARLIDGCDEDRIKWRSPLYMPRWASRITLEVTEVRVQRVDDLSLDDVFAELGETKEHAARHHAESWEPYDAWATLWDSINGKRAPYASRPWVWAITFRRVER